MSTHEVIRARFSTRIVSRQSHRSQVTHDGLRALIAFLASRHDDFLRREIAARHEVLAHQREVGGDLSEL